MSLTVFVPGHPAPQGSKQARPIYMGRGAGRVFTGKVAQQESSKALKPWRESVCWTVREHIGPVLMFGEGVAVSVRLTFVMPRPTSTPKRTTPPAVKKADLDKLVRGVFDALTASGAWHDDKQVVELTAVKRLAELDETPGCLIHVQAAIAEAA